jgi:hypothetical protein
MLKLADLKGVPGGIAFPVFLNLVCDHFVSSGEVLRPCCQQGGVLPAPYLCGGWLSRLGLVALVFARLSARPCSPLLLAFLGTDHINTQFKILRFLEGTSVLEPPEKSWFLLFCDFFLIFFL